MVDTTILLPCRDPYELPVTLETWRRLDVRLVEFYVRRGTRPTELAVQLWLKAFSRRKSLPRWGVARSTGPGRPLKVCPPIPVGAGVCKVA